MERDHLSIATITWARDAEEEELLRSALTELSRLGIAVYITDGGSNAGFLEFVEAIPHFHLVKSRQPGLWGQAKNSLRAAYESGAPFILYTEPDKKDFFQNGLPLMLTEIAVSSETGIFLAARSAAAFGTFPSFQRMSETTINNCCAEVTGKPLDFTYGPFLLNASLVPVIEKAADNIGWGWRPYAFGLAHRLGFTLEAHTGDFECPAGQRKDNPRERIYRMRQLEENVRGVVLSANADLRQESVALGAQ